MLPFPVLRGSQVFDHFHPLPTPQLKTSLTYLLISEKKCLLLGGWDRAQSTQVMCRSGWSNPSVAFHGSLPIWSDYNLNCIWWKTECISTIFELFEFFVIEPFFSSSPILIASFHRICKHLSILLVVILLYWNAWNVSGSYPCRLNWTNPREKKKIETNTVQV